MRVLIINGNKAISGIIQKSLTSMGFSNLQLSFASHCDTIQTIIQREQPELVFCDMNLPGPQAGKIFQTLQSHHPRIPLVIISIREDPLIKTITFDNNTGILIKPFSHNEFQQAVNKLIKPAAKPLPSITQGVPSHDLNSAITTLQRMLGNLANMNITFRLGSFADIDYKQTPFYSGALHNEGKKTVIAIFLDVVAANTLATIIGLRPISESLLQSEKKEINDITRQRLLAFLALFCSLYNPDGEGKSLQVERDILLESPSMKFKDYLCKHQHTTHVYHLHGDNQTFGKAIIVMPTY